MSSNNENKIENSEITPVTNEAIFFTGAALIGGTKLAYDVTKDIANRLKTNKKLFIQLVSSKFVNDNHLVRLRIANAYVHGLFIESINIFALKDEDYAVYTHHDSDTAGFGTPSYIQENNMTSFPLSLEPSSSKDLYIKIKKMELEKIKNHKGIELAFKYSSLDKPNLESELKIETRLLWPKEI